MRLKIRPVVVAAAGIIVTGAGLYLALGVHPAAPVVQHFAPTRSAAPAMATSAPMVAGASTTAPAASTAPATTAKTVAQTARATPKPTPVPVPAAKLMISEPDGQFVYAVPASQVTNACDILTAARNDGFLRSATLDNSYFSTLHSAYVREINGYENNWTFKVNGASPKGCSLASVTQGDTVSWTYQ